jgi:pyruvate dehydrogenase complex dehydrogenase (E1) component
MAGSEKLDNLIFVINCNLQRLDGPVRGNGRSSRNSIPNSAVPAGTSSS